MKISKRELMRIIQEECGMKQAHDKPVVLDVPVLEPAAVKAAVHESQSPEGELVVEMEMASRNLELAVESIGNAATLCPDCVKDVAVAAPLIEAMVSQAEALQETLDAVGAVLSDSVGHDHMETL